MSRIKVSRSWFSRYRSIQSAILDAEAGTVIEVEPGVYYEDLYIDRYIEIVGVGPREKTIICGKKYATVEMGTGYATIKNITLTQSRFSKNPIILVTKGALALDQCDVQARKGVGIVVVGDDAEPTIRRCNISSLRNVAILIRGQGKILFEDCQLSSQSDASVILVTEGNPLFRKCTITGNPAYGIFIENEGKGKFEECNLYGFNHSPAVGIYGGNPTFRRCTIHDGEESAIVIYRGKGVFEECRIYATGRDYPAVRVDEQSHPYFQHTVIKNCPGGAFHFEDQSGGVIENCDLMGFIDGAAVSIRTESYPQFIRTKIHDGNLEGISCMEGSKAILESCDLYSFNGDIVSVIADGRLDILRSRVYNGHSYGVLYSQKAEGMVQDTEIYGFGKQAAVKIAQAADPYFTGCLIKDSVLGLEIVENGRGTIENCTFQNLEQGAWKIEESEPEIRYCQVDKEPEEEKQEEKQMIETEPLAPVFKELDGFIGQKRVKKKVTDWIYYLDYLSDRVRLGFSLLEPFPVHSAFYGPPDTGKLELALRCGRILKKMGILEKGHLVVVDFSEGSQAVESLENKITEAKQGVLYLHRPELLKNEYFSDEERQATIQSIIPLLEKKLPDTAVIFSGREIPLKEWLQSHPFLLKNVKNQWTFTKFLPEEMVDLFIHLARQEDYSVHPSARPALLREMLRLTELKQGLSQWELVQLYLQKAKVRLSRRCGRVPKEERTREMLTTFLEEDLIMDNTTEIQPDHHLWLKELNQRLN